MNKEKLNMEAIRHDLAIMANNQVSCKAKWRLFYIIPITDAAILLGMLTKNIFIGIAVFCAAAYHIVRFIIEYKEYKMKKAAILSLIERGDISISTETLSHISNEVIYEPHRAGLYSRTASTKTITQYYFTGSASWRAPLCEKHYGWSRDFYISSKGLENISIAGDKFYFVSLQAQRGISCDISYIYPCKIFELDGSLKQ